MANFPMDVEYNFEWHTTRDRRKVPSQYLTPLKKRRLQAQNDNLFNRTQLVKCITNTPALHRKKWKMRLPRISVALIIGIFHLVLNLVIISVICSCALYLLFSVQKDVFCKIKERRIQTSHQVLDAKRKYEENRCHPSTRVPALKELCNKWECIIINGAESIGYTRIIVEVVGDVIDGFLRKFSVRSSVFMAGFFVLYLLFRRKGG